eukprot:3470751-Pyramimonas_sp.AAC.1
MKGFSRASSSEVHEWQRCAFVQTSLSPVSAWGRSWNIRWARPAPSGALAAMAATASTAAAAAG